MTKKKTQAPADQPAFAAPKPTAGGTRKQTLIDMMRTPEGATAVELGAAVGWQVHSIRGFIAGTLKKQADIAVLAERKDGATRYRVVKKAEAAA